MITRILITSVCATAFAAPGAHGLQDGDGRGHDIVLEVPLEITALSPEAEMINVVCTVCAGGCFDHMTPALPGSDANGGEDDVPYDQRRLEWLATPHGDHLLAWFLEEIELADPAPRTLSRTITFQGDIDAENRTPADATHYACGVTEIRSRVTRGDAVSRQTIPWDSPYDGVDANVYDTEFEDLSILVEGRLDGEAMDQFVPDDL